MTYPGDAAADAFAAALYQWRLERSLSKKQLAAEMGFDPSYVSHVEARRHRPTEDFARRAEAVLQAGGAIWQRFREYDQARHGSSERPRVAPVPEQWMPSTGGLIVESELSQLTYVNGAYRCAVRRDLFNAGTEPVTRYLVRVAVDRYPGEPERSNRHYRDHPLTWAELNLDARAGDERMRMTRKHDRDAYKEFWLHFENDDAHFPLYPGQRTRVEYAYTVGEDKWGHWFQRAIRLPTRRLEVRLDFPAELRPVVWGMEGTLTTDASPLRTPVVEETDGDRATFEWSTEDPPLNTRFRLEWRFRAAHADRVPEQAAQSRPSEVMRAAGVVQRGAPVLERAARWFDLPDQAPLAEEIIDRLLDAVERIGHLHDFRHGLGLAAPQLGISWAAAVVRETGADPIVLLNPRIVGESVDHDEQYEGCLSFFDVRGLVSRPLLIEVEHADLTGNTTVTTFRQEAARLVAHEIDHLGGLLYADRMPGDGRLVPAAEFSPEAR